MLTTLNQLHTDVIRFPVNYSGIPPHMIPINKLPDFIQIKIQASGYRLIMNRLQKTWTEKPIVIHLEKELNRKNKNLLDVSLQSKRNEISEQLGKQVTVLSIEPDSLHIQFDLKASRKIPVAVKSEWKFERGYGQAGPLTITPDSIEIIGSEAEICQIDTIFTFAISESQINKSINRIVEIDLPAGIQSKQTKVTVNLPVEQVSEKSLNCQLDIIADNNNFPIVLLQKNVLIKALVPNSMYHQISADDFKLGVYAKEASTNLPKLIVRVINKPSNVQILEINPPAVEYLIKTL